MDTIQKRTRVMKKALTNYNGMAAKFANQFPEHPTSPVIEYIDLLELEPDDPFWNNGIFTHSNKPWALDHVTQMGMRAIARIQRGREEHRRVGWEVRRAMRWATTSFDLLWRILDHLAHSEILPASIQPFLEHDIIKSASLRAKVSIVKGILHNELTRIARLSHRWDFKIKQVFLKTDAQVGDMHLMSQWQLQLQKMVQLRSNGFGSTKAGDFEHLMPRVPVRHDIIPEGVREGGPEEPDDGDLSDINEEEWAHGIDEGMMQNIIHDVGNEEPS